VHRSGNVAVGAAANSSTLNVLFITGVPDAVIYIKLPTGKMQSLGKTVAGGALNTRLVPGIYDIVASRPGSYMQRQRIEVRPGNTRFAFSFREEKGSSGSNAATAVTVAANDEPVSADDVFNRFLDPQQTSGVSLNDWQQAYAQTGSLFAQQPANRQARAQTLFAQGQMAYLQRDYANALVAFNSSALAMPESALAFYGLGNAYSATNQLVEAARAYQHAVELNDRLAMAYKGLGDVLHKQGKTQESLRYYERAAVLGYNPLEANRNAARGLMKMHRWKQALDELLKIAQVAPAADVYVEIGDCYVNLNQPLSAAPAFREALRLDAKSPLAYFKYGEILFNLREYAAAADALERALALDQGGNFFNLKRAREMATKAKNNLQRGR
jgi:tetratricopeptide (TPR) repeat protein